MGIPLIAAGLAFGWTVTGDRKIIPVSGGERFTSRALIARDAQSNEPVDAPPMINPRLIRSTFKYFDP